MINNANHCILTTNGRKIALVDINICAKSNWRSCVDYTKCSAPPTSHKIRQAGQNTIRVTSLAHFLLCMDGSTLLGYLGNFLSAQNIKDQLKGEEG
jgi:hypothetical protein